MYFQNGVSRYFLKPVLKFPIKTFFSNVGLKLAENIAYNGTKSVSSYLKRHVTSCFYFECVTPVTVNKYITELAAKNSCGPSSMYQTP